MSSTHAPRSTAPTGASQMQRYLLHVLERRAIQAGKDRTDVAALGIEGTSPTALSRILGGQTTSARLGIDVIVYAYAQVIGCQPIDLWREALTAWEQDPNGVELEAREAATRRAYQELAIQRRQERREGRYRNGR